MVRLGVVVPTRNRPTRIRDLLENLSTQTRRPDTVVVVDGSDTELMCRTIVESFENRLPIHYVTLHPPSAAAQRNVGLERVICHVDLVAFIDDDVILHGDALETACAGIAVAGSEFAGFGLNPVDEGAAREYGKLRDSRLAEKLGLYSPEVCAVSPSGWHTRPVTVDKDTEVQWLSTAAVIWRVDTVREVRFDEYFREYSYLEDLDFSLQARKRGRMKLLANVCYEHDPAPEGRKSRFWFGRIEVRNRQYIVRKHRLSQPRFVLGLAIRVGLTFVDVVRGRWSEAGRLAGNVYEIPRSIILQKGQPSRRHERVGNRR